MSISSQRLDIFDLLAARHLSFTSVPEARQYRPLSKRRKSPKSLTDKEREEVCELAKREPNLTQTQIGGMANPTRVLLYLLTKSR